MFTIRNITGTPRLLSWFSFLASVTLFLTQFHLEVVYSLSVCLPWLPYNHFLINSTKHREERDIDKCQIYIFQECLAFYFMIVLYTHSTKLHTFLVFMQCVYRRIVHSCTNKQPKLLSLLVEAYYVQAATLVICYALCMVKKCCLLSFSAESPTHLIECEKSIVCIFGGTHFVCDHVN